VVDLCTGLAAAKNALSRSRTQEIYCDLATERIDAWPPLTMSNAGKMTLSDLEHRGRNVG